MIWLIGKNGMLGSQLSSILKQNSFSFLETGSSEVDITSPDSISHFISDKNISIIINCAAYTAVDNGESDIDNAFIINKDGPKNLAMTAAKIGAKLIHISTDYVYGGDSSLPYLETDICRPINVYGKSKLEGENEIISSCKNYVILRTSWLYGLNGNNFVKTMINLMNRRDKLSIVNDQFGSPTNTTDLSNAIIRIIEADKFISGIYNFSNSGDITWYDFAQEIYKFGREINLVSHTVNISETDSNAFKTAAKRPKYSIMSKSKISEDYSIEITDWKSSLKNYLEKLKIEKI